MSKTHYEVLGVSPSSTPAEIRSAYRKLVLLHHPDRSDDPDSKAVFLAAAAAYDILGDRDKRRQYDERLAVEDKLQRERGTQKSVPRAYSSPSARRAEIKLDLNRLNALYSRGNFTEAEALAKSVIERDRREAVAYAILGNIASMKGSRGEAIRMYGFALQFDPKNSVYQQRYEELVDLKAPAPRPSINPAPAYAQPPRATQYSGVLFGLVLVLFGAAYVLLSSESPIDRDLAPISTWTAGLVAVLFLGGVALGASLALDGLLTRRGAKGSAFARFEPAIALASIALVSFWAAILMYAVIGFGWKTFSVTTSRLIATVTAGLCILSFAAAFRDPDYGFQVFLWGGNVMYLGALAGWGVTEALRGANG
ncbi:MAG TPA: DnaJ domain-containing protein [Fimbriimonadaceae bacterium]|nr:DnaJ domain-containing protein [Fimbriimonadaceae bacterium]